MYSLFVDTHMNKIVIVLFKDGKKLKKLERDSVQSHSLLVMPMIRDILERSSLVVEDLNELIVVNGPGSFTGVRIGVTIAKTMAYTLNIPIRVITSLEVLVASIDTKEAKIVSLNDRNGYFIGSFDEFGKLVGDYIYLSNIEYSDYILNNKVVKDIIEIDYEKVYKFAMQKDAINPHLVNPLYVKKIEVQK